jgi:hypothetical protein
MVALSSRPIWIAAAAALCLMLMLFLVFHFRSEGAGPSEICDNGADDDGDGLVDCDDIDCYGHVACLRSAPRGEEERRPTPLPLPRSAPVPVAEDAPRVASPAVVEIDTAACVEGDDTCGSECRADDECLLAIDALDCCGGHPHIGGDDGEEEICPTAVSRQRLASEPCVVPWDPGRRASPPEGCHPHCSGVRCSVCRLPARARCHRGRCVALLDGGCLSDAECEDGFVCLDPLRDGRRECVRGEHECDSDEECRERFPGCEGCNCLVDGEDQLRACLCWHCSDGTCSYDDDCAAHHFCVEHRCVDFGAAACHVGGEGGECSDDEACVPVDPQDGSSRRGRCRPIDESGEAPRALIGSETGLER